MGSSLLSRISNDLVLHQYHGAGNRFLIYDARKFNFPFVLIEKLCEYYEVDGILLLSDSLVADYQLRIFNPDASEAQMCGNGMRCLIRYLEEHSKKQAHYRIETLSGIIEAWHEKDEIGVLMPIPQVIDWNRRVHLDEKTYEAVLLKVGVPHLVVVLDDIEDIPIDQWGRELQSTYEGGVNVNFMQLSNLSIRTYERGVNRETLSCGTGATASAFVAYDGFQLPSPLIIYNRSKEKLTIRFLPNRAEMIGPAVRELCIKCPGQYNGWL